MKKFQKDWRKQRLNMKIIQYVADGFDTTPLVAKQMLLNLLK
jgi:hypothetical protein